MQFAITMAKAEFVKFIGNKDLAAPDKLKERLALFPRSGGADDDNVVTDQQVYAELKESPKYLSEKVFKSEAL